jgi:hypothetical protein
MIIINNCRNRNFQAIHQDHQFMTFTAKGSNVRIYPQTDKSSIVQYQTMILLAKAK